MQGLVFRLKDRQAVLSKITQQHEETRTELSQEKEANTLITIELQAHKVSTRKDLAL